MDWNMLSNGMAETIRDTNRLEALLSELGCQKINRRYNGREYRGPCPVHGGRKSTNFQVDIKGDTIPVRWACFSHHCEREYKPSLLGLVRGVLSHQAGKKVALRDAVKWLKHFIAVDAPHTSGASPPPPPKPKPKLLSLSREQVRAQLTVPSPFFLSRGFPAAILDQMDIGHSGKLGRSVVPFYDETGETCIGYQARSEQPGCRTCERFHPPDQPCDAGEDKWKVLAGFSKAAYLYNRHAVRSDLPWVLLVEGPGDVWAAASANAPAVSCLGTQLTAEQARLLVQVGKRVLVAFDNDTSGQDGAGRAVQRLRGLGVDAKAVIITPAYHDLGGMTPDAVGRWLRGFPR